MLQPLFSANNRTTHNNNDDYDDDGDHCLVRARDTWILIIISILIIHRYFFLVISTRAANVSDRRESPKYFHLNVPFHTIFCSHRRLGQNCFFRVGLLISVSSSSSSCAYVWYTCAIAIILITAHLIQPHILMRTRSRSNRYTQPRGTHTH